MLPLTTKRLTTLSKFKLQDSLLVFICGLEIYCDGTVPAACII